jgi:hypothetical protein
MHAFHRRAVLGAAALIAFALPAAAVADAPVHSESGDAGQTIATSQAIGGTGPLTSISGTADGGRDADLYKICITGTAPFSASVDGTEATSLPQPPSGLTSSSSTTSTSSTSSFSTPVLPNPMLTLVDANSKTFDFDDDNGVAGGAYLPSQTASVENPVPPAGVYYLGISPHPVYPVDSDHGLATEHGDTFADFYSGGEGDDEAENNFGSYVIKLTGAEACPATPTVAKVDGPLTPFQTDGSARFKFGTTLEIRVKPRDASGNLVTGLHPQVNIVRTGNPSGPQTPNVPFNSRSADQGKAMRYSEQFQQYQLYASTKKSQFNGGKDLTPGRYRVDVTEPAFPGGAHKVARNFAIVP